MLFHMKLIIILWDVIVIWLMVWFWLDFKRLAKSLGRGVKHTACGLVLVLAGLLSKWQATGSVVYCFPPWGCYAACFHPQLHRERNKAKPPSFHWLSLPISSSFILCYNQLWLGGKVGPGKEQVRERRREGWEWGFSGFGLFLVSVLTLLTPPLASLGARQEGLRPCVYDQHWREESFHLKLCTNHPEASRFALLVVTESPGVVMSGWLWLVQLPSLPPSLLTKSAPRSSFSTYSLWNRKGARPLVICSWCWWILGRKGEVSSNPEKVAGSSL